MEVKVVELYIKKTCEYCHKASWLCDGEQCFNYCCNTPKCFERARKSPKRGKGFIFCEECIKSIFSQGDPKKKEARLLALKNPNSDECKVEMRVQQGLDLSQDEEEVCFTPKEPAPEKELGAKTTLAAASDTNGKKTEVIVIPDDDTDEKGERGVKESESKKTDNNDKKEEKKKEKEEEKDSRKLATITTPETTSQLHSDGECPVPDCYHARQIRNRGFCQAHHEPYYHKCFPKYEFERSLPDSVINLCQPHYETYCYKCFPKHDFELLPPLYMKNAVDTKDCVRCERPFCKSKHTSKGNPYMCSTCELYATEYKEAQKLQQIENKETSNPEKDRVEPTEKRSKTPRGNCAVPNCQTQVKLYKDTLNLCLHHQSTYCLQCSEADYDDPPLSKRQLTRAVDTLKCTECRDYYCKSKHASCTIPNVCSMCRQSMKSHCFIPDCDMRKVGEENSRPGPCEHHKTLMCVWCDQRELSLLPSHLRESCVDTTCCKGCEKRFCDTHASSLRQDYCKACDVYRKTKSKRKRSQEDEEKLQALNQELKKRKEAVAATEKLIQSLISKK